MVDFVANTLNAFSSGGATESFLPASCRIQPEAHLFSDLLASAISTMTGSWTLRVGNYSDATVGIFIGKGDGTICGTGAVPGSQRRPDLVCDKARF